MADVIRQAGLEVERFREPGGQRRRLVRIYRLADAGGVPFSSTGEGLYDVGGGVMTV
jgi:hypothetical protein